MKSEQPIRCPWGGGPQFDGWLDYRSGIPRERHPYSLPIDNLEWRQGWDAAQKAYSAQRNK